MVFYEECRPVKEIKIEIDIGLNREIIFKKDT